MAEGDVGQGAKDVVVIEDSAVYRDALTLTAVMVRNTGIIAIKVMTNGENAFRHRSIKLASKIYIRTHSILHD